MVLKVFRWSPGTRERLQKYWVRARQGMTVLDALVELQRGSEPTPAFRYACGVGMCGSSQRSSGPRALGLPHLASGLSRGAVTVRLSTIFPHPRSRGGMAPQGKISR
jgi:succinate dehydrogenase/fumarate reductase-like Fe-S protein